ncbi:MAG: FG-GAP-like repeat-containing protein [Deltaproteobacteria bacterium]|nr:FG-GAP-like repeat-containing protein [Deltaproteobacteria bacterium]
MRSDRIAGLALTLALGLLGCETSPFRCAGRGPTACVGAAAVCTTDGYCATAVDRSRCPSGLQYSSTAAQPGACVAPDAAPIDASTDAPMVDVPAIDVPAIDVPTVDVPTVDVPTIDVPTIDVPTVDVPAVDVPGIDAVDVADVPEPDTGPEMTVDVPPLADVTLPADVPTRCLPPRMLWPMSTSHVTIRRPSVEGTFDDRSTTSLVAAEFSRTRDFAAPLRGWAAAVAGQVAVRPPSRLAPGVWFWRLRSVCNVGGSDTLGPASAVWEFIAPAGVGSPVDSAWGSALDVNGDGLADLAVADPTRGIVSLYFGRAGGLVGTPSQSPYELGAHGASLDSAGDVNGDGYGDLITGACPSRQEQNLRSPTPCAQIAVVRLGSPTGVSTRIVLTAPTAPGVGMHFGTAVAGIGDFDHDGYGDVVVGSGFTPAVAAVVLYRGGPRGVDPSAPIVIPAPSALGVPPPARLVGFGAVLASAGDLDGDRNADFVVGAPGVNRVAFFRGVRGTFQGDRLPSTQSDPAELTADLSATALSLAGDLDGDGLSDVLVGAPALNRFTVMFGNTLRPPVVLTLLAPAGLHLGGALAGGFDANADGLSDFVVGAQVDGSPGGRAYLYTGRAAWSRAVLPTAELLPPVTPPAAPTRYGASAGGTGDCDGDGLDDWTVGAPGYVAGDSPVMPFPVQLYSGSAALGTPAGPSLLEGRSIVLPSGVVPSTFGRGLR